MSRFLLLLTVVLGLVPTVARAALRVVTTVPDLAAIARAVGGDRVTVQSLALPTQDPHFVDARPSLVLDLNRADLLLAVGLELEVGWLGTLQTGARNARIQSGGRGFLDCSRLVERLGVPAGRVDRSMGDIHPGGNPHYLYDPRAAMRVARGIAERLGELDPEGKAAYAAGLQRFTSELEAARAGWEKRLASLRGMPLVTYHESFPYLASWLGFQTVAFIEPKPGIPPNPSHVAQVISLARSRQVRLVLQESYYPDTTVRLVADKVGAQFVRIPAGTDVRAGQSYREHIEEIVTLLERALKAKETP
ncbi:zinc ABC transporter substrate-binding protein [Pyxidicoccus fallax]|uniref:Zinc ABC transporter substrate-binding protein n=1 Tax=Pyxidicoccus fallax TaxID=394095 RepID=A0A848LW90_9BACT|nr:metal ABC transporter substrate-binding protein [Pyxidicoccus fallax]NMO21901.1 zinc ABC transporter substrate-binding protein [Pyxidicoccus fallax]NPC85911.1 zinc ABC transporter substrate-binding protein [Pyxidicoccus fallax]